MVLRNSKDMVMENVSVASVVWVIEHRKCGLLLDVTSANSQTPIYQNYFYRSYCLKNYAYGYYTNVRLEAMYLLKLCHRVSVVFRHTGKCSQVDSWLSTWTMMHQKLTSTEDYVNVNRMIM